MYLPGGKANPQAAEKLVKGIPEESAAYVKPKKMPELNVLIWMKKIGGVHIENCIYLSGIWLYTLQRTIQSM